nr:MAG TPA: hypothetical protein [Bacteriophage sp.]
MHSGRTLQMIISLGTSSILLLWLSMTRMVLILTLLPAKR